MTGRGLGPCGTGRGLGRGLGRRAGRGLGLGWRRPLGICPWYPQYGEPTKKEEQAMLKDEAEMLKEELEAIKARLAEIEKEK